jgi:hypothetical protein
MRDQKSSKRFSSFAILIVLVAIPERIQFALAIYRGGGVPPCAKRTHRLTRQIPCHARWTVNSRRPPASADGNDSEDGENSGEYR